MKFTVKTVPASGDTKKTEVDINVELTEATVNQVLAKAGVKASKSKITVNGKVVSGDSYIPRGTTVTLTEKVKGS